MVLMIALSACMFFSNISWFCMEILCGKVSFGFSTLWIMAMPASSANWCVVFSDDAQVPHLSQWFFLALGMELLLEAFSVLEDLMDYYASHNTCKNLPFVKDYIQATYNFPTTRAGTQASWYVCLFP